MSLRRSVPRYGVGVLLAGCLTLAACGGSDASKPSQAKVEQQLRKDPTFSTLIKALPQAKADSVISCFAKQMEKGVDAGDLNDYVKGNKKLEDLQGSGSDAEDSAKQAQKCITSATGS